MSSNSVPAPVARSLELWHLMIAQRDLSKLPSIVAPDAVFRSPAFYKPYHSDKAVCLILNTVMTVFEQFEYHRTFTSESGLDVVLEFSAVIGDKQLKGMDIIRFDEDGKIVEFEVMIRPLNALQKLAEAMSEKLSAYLPKYKETPPDRG